MTNCGPGGNGTESCCTSLPVPGGTYYRTFSNDGTGPTGEADPATVSGFRLDKYLVTVGRFRQFVNAWRKGWTPPAGSGRHVHLNGGWGLVDVGAPVGVRAYESGWQTSDDDAIAPTDGNLLCEGDATWTPAPGTQENLPINCLNWVEAQAFCIWDQAFLPSEAEWGYAAAGGTEQREYPWGSTNPGTASQYAIYGCLFPPGANRNCTGVVNYAPVGTPAAGAGLWGQLDIEGEVYEWVLDWFSQAYVDPCIDCGLLTAPPGAARVYRGGPLTGFVNYLITWQRNSWDPYAQGDGPGDIGIRCARTP
jgi:formylglycine-generating enzyme required for sulfatase activity